MNYFDESFKEVKETKFETKDMNMGDNMGMPMNNNCCAPTMGGCCNPVYECPQERVCHRFICYDVPHIMPCNTKIINHHIYKHTYQPVFTCSEENVCEQVFERNCCM